MNFDKKIKTLGAMGEIVAANFLTKKGYRIIDRNFHAQGGEIDIIARDKAKDWILVEVKTRSTDTFGSGVEAITKSKIEKMCSAAERFFLQKLKMKEVPEFQIDAIILRVDQGKMFAEHIENIGLDDF